jgi:hypothetical protein
MLARWSASAFAVAVLAVVAMPATGQDPPPACPPGTQLTPDRFGFHHNGDMSATTQSETVGHRADLFISVPGTGPWDVSATQITGPPGLQISTQGDNSDQDAAFTPTAPGQLTFTATWTQLKEPSGPACTGSASASLTATAPKPVRVLRGLFYSLGHFPGHTGAVNEFVLTADVMADGLHGDTSPFRFTARAVKDARRPPASTPAVTVTFDPNHSPFRGVDASNGLVRLHAGYHGSGPTTGGPTEYEFTAGVFARPSHARGQARRGVEMTLSQGSRTLATFHFVTSCDSAWPAGLLCYPQPTGSAR